MAHRFVANERRRIYLHESVHISRFILDEYSCTQIRRTCNHWEMMFTLSIFAARPPHSDAMCVCLRAFNRRHSGRHKWSKKKTTNLQARMHAAHCIYSCSWMCSREIESKLPFVLILLSVVVPACICTRWVAYARACICMQVPVRHVVVVIVDRMCDRIYKFRMCSQQSWSVSEWKKPTQSIAQKFYSLFISVHCYYCLSLYPSTLCRVSPLNTNRPAFAAYMRSHTFVTPIFTQERRYISAMTDQMWAAKWRFHCANSSFHYYYYINDLPVAVFFLLCCGRTKPFTTLFLINLARVHCSLWLIIDCHIRTNLVYRRRMHLRYVY